MKKDTKTFLLAVLGIPFALTLAVGVHAGIRGSEFVVEREEEFLVEPVVVEETPVVPAVEVETVPEVAVEKPVVTKVPVSEANPTPVAVEVPVVVQTPETVVEPVRTPAKKKSRRTRAS